VEYIETVEVAEKKLVAAKAHDGGSVEDKKVFN
jgi:hypothetical protein